MKEMKKRYKSWIILLAIAFWLMFITKSCGTSSVKSDMLVNCPKCMESAMEKFFSKSGLYKIYNLVFTDNVEKANFVVSEGVSNNTNELLAYSPIIALSNSDEKYYQSLIDAKYLVEAQSAIVDADDDAVYDLDFKKIMDEIIDGTSSFKVYCPTKTSGMWEEFYNFLIITENDGAYPNKEALLKEVKARVNMFLESNNVGYVDLATKGRINGFAKNSITFTTITEFYNAYSAVNDSDYTCRIMYPKYVVYHDYYMSYDDVGTVVKNALNITTVGYYNIGYEVLSWYFFNNNFKSSYKISSNVLGTRSDFNVVEIPEVY